MVRVPTHRPPTHPGEMLLEEFLKPLGLTQTELAERIGVPFQRINSLVNGKRSLTPDTALRLSRMFGTTPGFWMNTSFAGISSTQNGMRATPWSGSIRYLDRT